MPAIRSPRLFLVIIIMTMFASAGLAELQNHGLDGEYFHDTVSGLYWMDPSLFHGQARITLDHLANYSTTWSWATSTDVDGLLTQTAETGSVLEDVIGPRRSTLGHGGPRWLGYYFGSGDDGWLAQSDDTPDFITVTATGTQANAAALGAGAWFVSAVDPVTTSAVIENVGPYFHDLSTDLYWCEPNEFAGYSRTYVEGWLVSNPDWRWATEADVFGLLGKCTVDGDPLEDVIGLRSATITNGGPRWVGYFNMNGVVDGLILQSGFAPGFYIFDTGSTQANAQAFNAGAWLVSETNPMPNEDTSWGDVKRDYR